MKLSIPLLFVFLAGCATAVKAPQDSPSQGASIPPASVAKGDTPAAKPPAKSPASSAPPVAARKQDAPAATQQGGPAPLDLKALEQQLKETKAIGVMTKLSLKNQVDDLLEQFRAYYQGRLKTTLADLRRPYEMLLMKVLAVLQDGDPALAKAINASREAIWGVLADPDKFAKVAS